MKEPALLKYPSTNLLLQDFMPLVLSFITLRIFFDYNLTPRFNWPVCPLYLNNNHPNFYYMIDDSKASILLLNCEQQL